MTNQPGQFLIFSSGSPPLQYISCGVGLQGVECTSKCNSAHVCQEVDYALIFVLSQAGTRKGFGKNMADGIMADEPAKIPRLEDESDLLSSINSGDLDLDGKIKQWLCWDKVSLTKHLALPRVEQHLCWTLAMSTSNLA